MFEIQGGDSSWPLVRNCRFRHYKGNVYRGIGLGRHSETREWLVIYAAEADPGEIWVRPAEMFFESITIDGTLTPRFSSLANPGD